MSGLGGTSLDSLLEDLDEISKEDERQAGLSSKYAPHPPVKTKTSSNATHMNPKTKFAVSSGFYGESSPPRSISSAKENVYSSPKQGLGSTDSFDDLMRELDSADSKAVSPPTSSRSGQSKSKFTTYTSSPVINRTNSPLSNHFDSNDYHLDHADGSRFKPSSSTADSKYEKTRVPYTSNTSTGSSSIGSQPYMGSSSSLGSGAMKPVSNPGAKRCVRVVLSGPAMQRGLKSSSFSKIACDRMRCMKCNFEVLAFAGRAWTAHVDYMFFRNNRSNEGKLSSALAAAADSVAYCCQCSWANVTDGADREISMNAGLGLSAASAAPGDALEWICCGHS